MRTLVNPRPARRFTPRLPAPVTSDPGCRNTSPKIIDRERISYPEYNDVKQGGEWGATK